VRAQLTLAAVGATLLVAVLSARTSLPFAGPQAQPMAAALVLLLLFAFALAFFAFYGWLISLLPSNWPAAVRWPTVFIAAVLLALPLRFFQFIPAFLVFGWCKASLPCGEVGNLAFNSLLSSGRGVLILLSLPLITIPVLLVGHYLQGRSKVQA
jgi:hypothetical protein